MMGRSHETIEVHDSGRADHAVESDAHSRRDALAYVVWHRAHQPLKQVARNRGHKGVGSRRMNTDCWKFITLQRIASAIAVVLLAIWWGRGAAVGFCFVSALAIVQECMIACGIAEARRLNSNVRNACAQGIQAKFPDVFLVGLCRERLCGVGRDLPLHAALFEQQCIG